MKKMTVRDVDVAGKKVLMRVDFNVTMDEKTGAITDDSRIRASLPTINYLVDKGSMVILMSHFGRPKGVDPKLSLKPVGKRLSELIKKNVVMAPDCVGPEVQKLVTQMKPGDVMLLENLRFHEEEEKGMPSFAVDIALMGDLYVDDAFGTAHRAHASITGVATYRPAVAGFLMEKEIDNLSGILESPEHPFFAVMGGAKISDKLTMVQNIMGKVDGVMIGGGMAATFFKAKGMEVGKSLVDEGLGDTITKLLTDIEKKKANLMLPVDVLVADKAEANAKTQVVSVDRIPKDMMIVDIGAKTTANFVNELKKCKTVFWNGPMGIYEISAFAKGTREIASAIASLKAKTVIGGGSTADMVMEMGLADKMTHVSTGGGASLNFLGGEKLPGIEILPNKK